jgi:hypothetical protein
MTMEKRSSSARHCNLNNDLVYRKAKEMFDHHENQKFESWAQKLYQRKQAQEKHEEKNKAENQ